MPPTSTNAVQVGATRRSVAVLMRRRRSLLFGTAVVAGLAACLLISTFPRSFLLAGGVLLCVVAGWIGWNCYTRRRTEREAEQHLAGARCPCCSKLFGSEVARWARAGIFAEPPALPVGPLIKGELRPENFGYWLVECPHCSTSFHFHPEAHDFEFHRRAA
jgi:hypothetical protein